MPQTSNLTKLRGSKTLIKQFWMPWWPEKMPWWPENEFPELFLFQSRLPDWLQGRIRPTQPYAHTQKPESFEWSNRAILDDFTTIPVRWGDVIVDRQGNTPLVIPIDQFIDKWEPLDPRLIPRQLALDSLSARWFHKDCDKEGKFASQVRFMEHYEAKLFSTAVESRGLSDPVPNSSLDSQIKEAYESGFNAGRQTQMNLFGKALASMSESLDYSRPLTRSFDPLDSTQSPDHTRFQSSGESDEAFEKRAKRANLASGEILDRVDEKTRRHGENYRMGIESFAERGVALDSGGSNDAELPEKLVESIIERWEEGAKYAKERFAATSEKSESDDTRSAGNDASGHSES